MKTNRQTKFYSNKNSKKQETYHKHEVPAASRKVPKNTDEKKAIAKISEPRINDRYYEPEKIEVTNSVNIKIGKLDYLLVHNHRNGFNAEKLGERFSEVLSKYDYIIGDWGHEQLRLRGFFRLENKQVYLDQKIDTLVDYLYEFCNFGCSYFVLERVGELGNVTGHSAEIKKDATDYRQKKKKLYRNHRKVNNKASIGEKKDSDEKGNSKNFVIRNRLSRQK